MNSFPLSALIKGQLLSLTSALCFILLESWINSWVIVKRSICFFFNCFRGEKEKRKMRKKQKEGVFVSTESDRDSTSPPSSCPSSLKSEADINLQLSHSQLKQIRTHTLCSFWETKHMAEIDNLLFDCMCFSPSLLAASFLHFFLLILKDRSTIFQVCLKTIIRCPYKHWNRLTVEASYQFYIKFRIHFCRRRRK